MIISCKNPSLIPNEIFSSNIFSKTTGLSAPNTASPKTAINEKINI